MRRHATGAESHTAVLDDTVAPALDGPGQPLSPALRAEFEPRLRRDLSQVRVHVGPAPARSPDALGARAYTVGRHIVFGAGQWAPLTPGSPDRPVWCA
ncbi:DUF4157 domain-containing protein [Actinoplanes sp. CA-030573]|uniref:eCIS core domain-containing protein n=1 Tax=Actinoplanes sp. CA-030573 TaxID=3239898 RepID=UPI003D9486F1